MSINSSRGSEWRRWDLHIHTKGTNKNDQFNASVDFDDYCVTMFKKAIDKRIAAIGITDYFSVDKYKKVIDFVARIDSCKDFDTVQKEYIKNILVLPNVELRMLPVTDRGRLVNIHCIFNPAIVSRLDNKFFASIDYHDGRTSHKMNRQGFIEIGKSFDDSLDDDTAYKRGIDTFHVDYSKLQEVLKDEIFDENTIVVVSNSSNDGVSAFQKHYDFFEGSDPGSLDGVRRAIYTISQAIFSSNRGDRKYFLGLGDRDNEKAVKDKCGSLKPCIHGSDAHTESKLFEPDNDRFCWIKADTTFEGLRQIVYEPADRVYVGLEPPVIDRVRSNKTKYIDALNINQVAGYNESQGVWFKDVEIDFNKELVAIIGNKGSGKSAISDVIGLLGNTHNAGDRHENLSFLCADKKKLKFRKKGYAENFQAELVWEDGTGRGQKIPLNHDIDPDDKEKVKYLPQNYFENLTNDLEGGGFDKTLKGVIFRHLPEEQRLGSHSFEELEDIKAKSIEADLADIRGEVHDISEDIIKLEEKKHPSYTKQLASQLEEKQRELKEHDKIRPDEVLDPEKSSDNSSKEEKNRKYKKLEELNVEHEGLTSQIAAKKIELADLAREQEELDQLKKSLARIVGQVEAFKKESAAVFKKYGLDVGEAIELKHREASLMRKIEEKGRQASNLKDVLRTKESIDADPDLIGQPKKLKVAYKISLPAQKDDISKAINKIKKDLSKPEKDFQEYKEKLSKWKNKRKAIEGSKEQLGSLKYYQNELDFVAKSLPSVLAKRRAERLSRTLAIFAKQKEIIELYGFLKESVDNEIAKDKEFAKKFKMVIDINFKLDPSFAGTFLHYINKSKKGTFYGANESSVEELFAEKDLLNDKDISQILNTIIKWLEVNQKESKKEERRREILDQVDKVQELYDYLFSLEYLRPIYELKLDSKVLEELSPGEKGTLLLVFYLMIDKEDTPLIIDQPEDNLDNKSVFEVLTHFIKTAKKRRQIIIVTHNPNLAVGADAEQVIYVNLDKRNGKNLFSFQAGAIENQKINERIVEILEGTMPAFDRRKLRYKKS